MSEQRQGTDTSAAFLGLIGGALFIGAIMTLIVWYTNAHFEKEKSEGGKAVAEAESAFG